MMVTTKTTGMLLIKIKPTEQILIQNNTKQNTKKTTLAY